MRTALLTLTLFLLAGVSASAVSLVATVDDPDRVVGLDFTRVDFYGTITYIGGGDYAYERLVYSGGSFPDGLSVYPAFANLRLNPGDSYEGLLFCIERDAYSARQITPGVYQGYMRFLAQTPLWPGYEHVISTERLYWTLTVVPEPSTLSALTLGLLPLGWAIRRRRS